MATASQYYVDPSLGSDTGDGSKSTPWGRASGSVVQYALDNITRDGTNGDQINVKSGTDDVVSSALSFATYGSSSYGNPIILRGYDTDENDGGQGGISGGGSSAIHAGSQTALFAFDMHLHSCGSADIWNGTGQYQAVANCEFDNTTGTALDCSAAHNKIVGNYFHNCGTNGFQGQATIVTHNYFANGTNDFTAAILLEGQNTSCAFNIISIDGASNGIDATTWGCNVFHNSVLSSSGTGFGIEFPATGIAVNYSNVVEGFSGAGGQGFKSAGGDLFIYGYAAAYNNTTNYPTLPDVHGAFGDNETLGASGFAKSGSDTFANRLTYFAPTSQGNMQVGAQWGPQFKGAVMPSAGGSSLSFINTRRSILIGR